MPPPDPKDSSDQALGLPVANEAQAWLAQVLSTRTTVHDYRADPVPDGLLEAALEVALAAPNHRLTEPWRFVLVGREAREQLASISVALKRQKGGLAPKAEQEIRHKLLNPPHLIAVCRVRHEKPEVEREDYAAIACAIQNFSVYLWAHGVGSKWSTGAVTTAAETYAALAVPSQQEIVGFVWVGWPSGVPNKPRRKQLLADVVRHVR